MILLPLGTCSANKNPTRAFSSYLFKTEDFHFLVDVGSYRVKDTTELDFRKLRYVFLTHNHGDHSWHIGALVKRYLAFWKRNGSKRNAPPLHIFFGLKPLTPLLLFSLIGLQLLPNFWRIFTRLRLHPIRRGNLEEPRVIFSRSFSQRGTMFEVRATKADHPGGALGYAFRLLKNGSSPLKITFVPDTSPLYPPIIRLGRDSDYFFHDCTFPQPYMVKFAREKGRFLRMTHSSPPLAARTATRAGARVFGVIHYWDARFPNKDHLRATIQREFTGPIILTNDLEPVELHGRGTTGEK